MKTPTLPLHDSSQWPIRMRRAEVAHVLRISERELRRRVAEYRFPASDDGRTWERGVVERYAKNVKAFERNGERATTTLRMVGAHR